jgi:hypothetical protein
LCERVVVLIINFYSRKVELKGCFSVYRPTHNMYFAIFGKSFTAIKKVVGELGI